MHEVVILNGLHFCRACGRHAVPGSRGLRQLCVGRATDYGQRVLNRLAERPPRPPYRMKAWPDGTPAEPGPRVGSRISVAGSTMAQPPRRPPAGAKPQAGTGGGVKRAGGRLAKEPPPKVRCKILEAMQAPTSGRPAEPSAAISRLQALRERVRAKEAAAKRG